MKIYIIIFLLILITYLWFQNRTEKFTNAEAVESISKVYGDSSGTLIVNNIQSGGNINGNNINSNNLFSNKITAENIDVSNNMNVSGNINIKGNIDISGTINGQNLNKDYFICTFAGKTKLNVTKSSDLNLLNKNSWNSRDIMYTTRSNNLLNIDWDNGKIIGLKPEVIYKVEAYIQFNSYNINTDPTLFVAKLKNGGEFLNESMAFAYQDKVNFTLTPVTIVKGSNATLLNISMIRWGGDYIMSNSSENKEVLVTICITQL
jgi:hypothetical protein